MRARNHLRSNSTPIRNALGSALLIALGLISLAPVPAAAVDASARVSGENASNGTLYVYGYKAGAASDAYALKIAGKRYQPKAGAVGVKLAEGIHEIQLLTPDQDQVLATLSVFVDAQTTPQLLLTLDKLGSVDYKVQDSASKEVFDAGTLILPGMESVIRGTVSAEQDGELVPLPNAVVGLEGTELYTLTNVEGAFEFKDLPDGGYRLIVAADGYEPIEPIQFTLAPKESAEHNLSVAQILETLAAIEVTADGVTQQAMAVEEERSSAAVAEVVNAEQIKRGGDSEASSALKRVTGLSVVGGKFVYVRGLGERYSSVLLNGAQIPSPDPTRRVVPLDLFPTDIIDSVVVQKSYSADMPGEFGGGTVQLRTKEAPRKAFVKLSLGSGYQQGSTGKKGLRYDGGNRDWFGSDQVRAVPNELASVIGGGRQLGAASISPAQREAASEAVAALGFDTRRSSLDPNLNAALSAGMGGDLASAKWSVLGALRIANSWENNLETRRSYLIAPNAAPVLVRDIEREVTERSGAQSGLMNAVLRLNGDHRISMTSALLRQNVDQAQIDQGYRETPEDITRSVELEWIENRLTTNQFSGEHFFAGLRNLSLNWQYTDSRARRDAPGKRAYSYQLIGNEFLYSNGSDSNSIVFEGLNDGAEELRLGAALPVEFGEESSVNLAFGVGRLERDRVSELRRFKFSSNSAVLSAPAVTRLSLDRILSPQNIRADGYILNEITRTLDNYVATQQLDSLYLNADASLGGNWRISGGARRENNEQRISTFDVATPNAGRIEGGSDDGRWLPAVAATYLFGEDQQQQLRFSFGRSVSRADFREYSPAPFLDPILDIESFGNPNLVATSIGNFDLRWERYFDGDEVISAALFYKRLDKPIERVTVPGTGGLLSFENADSARNFGVELEGFLQLGRFTDSLQDYFLASNISWLDSEVKLGASGVVQTARSRPLQGQSKYLANVQFGYKSERSPIEFAASYNVSGPRISQVGAFGLADTFEEPFHQLDFTMRYKFDSQWSAGLRLRNALDERVEFTRSGLSSRSFKPGPELAFSVEWAPLAE